MMAPKAPPGPLLAPPFSKRLSALCGTKKLQMPFFRLREREVFLDLNQIFKLLLSGIQRNPERFGLGERKC